MTFRRRIIRLLDRPGGRGVLARLGSRQARKVWGPEAAIFYDAFWFHRFRGYAIPDFRRFDYYDTTIAGWGRAFDERRRDVEDYWYHAYQPQPGDTIIDVGAGVGNDVLSFSERVGPTGRVIAIEAHPTTCEVLRRFCARNRLGNVACLNLAVVDRPGDVRIEDQEHHETNRVLAQGGEGAGSHSVPGLTLDEICRRQGVERIDFLKMNIEGAEGPALEGMGEAIGRTRSVCIACHDFRAERDGDEFFRTRDRVVGFLRDHDFEVRTRSDDPRPYVRDHVHGRNLRLP